jgi:hypothetical protein
MIEGIFEMPVGGAEMRVEELWVALVDAVHALPMYKNHRRYVEDVMLKERPDISAKELTVQLNIPFGESLVLLKEIRGEKAGEGQTKPEGLEKVREKTLFDFGV